MGHLPYLKKNGNPVTSARGSEVRNYPYLPGGVPLTPLYPLVPYDRYTGHSEPSQLARGDLGALRYAPGTVGKLTMSPFHRRIAGFVKLDTREMALVAIRRLPHCQAR